MALLSIGEDFTVASGDWIQLAGAFVWGVHVLLVSFFVSRHDAIRLAFLQFATCAVVSLLLALIFEDINPASIWLAGPALIYGGLFAVAVGYTLQVVAQKHAIASHAAIILSLEAVFAAIAGALFLEESLTAWLHGLCTDVHRDACRTAVAAQTGTAGYRCPGQGLRPHADPSGTCSARCAALCRSGWRWCLAPR